jgi:hypothetical protein
MKMRGTSHLLSAQPQALGEPKAWVALHPTQSSGKFSPSSLGSLASRVPSL